MRGSKSEIVSINGHNPGETETRARLVEAVFQLLLRHSQAHISVRMLANTAQTSVSAIDYHFGGLEQLYYAVQRAAIERAQRWTKARLDDLAELGIARCDDETMGSLLAAVIDEWCNGRRELALAWREAQCRPAMTAEYEAINREWAELWQAFWTRTCELCGRRGDAALIGLFFDGESFLHLLHWRRPLDRVVLGEGSRIWCHWLSGADLPEAQMRVACHDRVEAEHQASAENPAEPGSLELAAADLLTEGGVAAVTFRAVAARAGATLGTATYHFGSKPGLLSAAFRTLYYTNVRRGASRRTEPAAPQMSDMRDQLATYLAGRREPILRAMDEVVLQICRSEERDPLCGPMRYLRGTTSRSALQKLLGRPNAAPLGLAASFSSFAIGLDHSCIGMQTDEAVRHVGAMLDDFCSRNSQEWSAA